MSVVRPSHPMAGQHGGKKGGSYNRVEASERGTDRKTSKTRLCNRAVDDSFLSEAVQQTLCDLVTIAIFLISPWSWIGAIVSQPRKDSLVLQESPLNSIRHRHVFAAAVRALPESSDNIRFHSRSVVLCNLFTHDKHLVVGFHLFCHCLVQSISHAHLLDSTGRGIIPPLRGNRYRSSLKGGPDC